MKLLTRYPHTGSTASLAVCLGRDAASTRAPKRASFLVRLPYYIFLTCMGAVYYGYVISLNIRWLILQEHRVWLSLIFLSIFHLLFVMFLWSLLATVYRGPGAVGEVLIAQSTNAEDLEAGVPSSSSEAVPLMQNVDEESSLGGTSNEPLLPHANGLSPLEGGSGSRWRRQRSSSKSRSNEGSSDEQEDTQDYLELQAKLDYGDSSDDEDEEAEETTSSGGNKKKRKNKPIEIIYPGQLGTSLTAKANGKARFCRKCNVSKPDRSHHCSTCGFCVLKMDHHCPWIGGCVGFKNYKTFILFLFYADLLSVYICVSSFWALVQVLDRDMEELGLAPVGWGFLVLFGFLFSVMLTGFFPYHLYLSMNNRSTIENMERNGRLLSLPTKAETLLSAGVTDPHAAGLPERPRSGAGSHLLPGPGQPRPPPPGFEDSSSSYRPPSQQQQQRNPFLPTTTPSATASLASNLNLNNNTNTSAALTSLSRTSKRDLERKAGKINIYDLGTWQANFRETFGSDWNTLIAWLPVGKSNGSGYEWPVNKRHFDKLKAINDQLRLPSGAV